jgi:hypothetical protein
LGLALGGADIGLISRPVSGDQVRPPSSTGDHPAARRFLSSSASSDSAIAMAIWFASSSSALFRKPFRVACSSSLAVSCEVGSPQPCVISRRRIAAAAAASWGLEKDCCPGTHPPKALPKERPLDWRSLSAFAAATRCCLRISSLEGPRPPTACPLPTNDSPVKPFISSASASARNSFHFAWKISSCGPRKL